MTYRTLVLSVFAVASLGCSERGALPQTFPASGSTEWLASEFELDRVWSVSHPEYDSEIRILLTSVPVKSLSPNYRVAFYEPSGDIFVRIDTVFEFGGFKPPELGRHPELNIPAIVAEMETIPERIYFFVLDEKLGSFREFEEEWTVISQHGERVISKRDEVERESEPEDVNGGNGSADEPRHH